MIFQTTLTEDIDAGTIDLPLADPMEPYTVLVIDDEYIALMEPTMRGVCRTTPTSHKAGTTAWVVGAAMRGDQLAPSNI